jgi:hypothetical protein
MKYPIYFEVTAAGGTGWAQDAAPPAGGPGTGTTAQNARTYTLILSKMFPGASPPSANISFAYVGPAATPDCGVDIYQWVTNSSDANGNWLIITNADPVTLKSGKSVFDFAHIITALDNRKLQYYVRLRANATAVNGSHKFYISPVL